MPILKNSKHERFAQGLAKGLTATDAYAEAGYSGDRGHASRLAANGNIKARVTEVLTGAASRVEITQARVLEELGKIGFSNMLDYISVQNDGTAYVDLSALDRDKAAAIQEVIVDSYEEHDPASSDENAKRAVKKIKFKLSDKRAALVDIGKHLGMFKETLKLEGMAFNVTISKDA